MEETNQSSTDHRGLKLQNIIQKLSEHCDIKNPEELDSVAVDEEIESEQGVPETKRRKQDTSETSVNGTGNNALHSSTEKNTDEQNSDSKQRCNITKSEQQEDTSCKATPTIPPGRISARIRSLKSKKVAYKEDWVDPDQIRLTGQKIPVQSNKNTSQEEITKTKTVVRKRKRKKKESFQSMEDYVNDAPVIQVGNLVGLRQCCLCAVMFVEKEQLINHMKAVHHLDDKINIKQDTAAESLQSDDKTNDEKPFKCSQCESSFRKSSGLKQHVTRQHSQNAQQKLTSQAQANQASVKRSSSASDRPYACQVCGKAFKRKHHLQEHSYIHSDDKPYKCDTCSKTFNQRICLTKHLPCREHEKQQRKPSSTKTQETSTDQATHEQPQNQATDKLCDSKETKVSLTETGKGRRLANGVVSKSGESSHGDHCGTPQVKSHMSRSERDGKIQVTNGEPLRDNATSKDTQKPLQGHATYAVDSKESGTDNSKLNFSGSTVTAVTTNDQTSSVKNPTLTSQKGTKEAS
ncbi:hypothetical protein ACROYT_G009462 [Oculina patagonica]